MRIKNKIEKILFTDNFNFSSASVSQIWGSLRIYQTHLSTLSELPNVYAGSAHGVWRTGDGLIAAISLQDRISSRSHAAYHFCPENQ